MHILLCRVADNAANNCFCCASVYAHQRTALSWSTFSPYQSSTATSAQQWSCATVRPPTGPSLSQCGWQVHPAHPTPRSSPGCSRWGAPCLRHTGCQQCLCQGKCTALRNLRHASLPAGLSCLTPCHCILQGAAHACTALVAWCPVRLTHVMRAIAAKGQGLASMIGAIIVWHMRGAHNLLTLWRPLVCGGLTLVRLPCADRAG